MKKNEPLLSSNSIDSLQRIIPPVAFALSAVLIGTIGYVLIEHMTPLDSLYLTIASMFLTVSYLDTIKFSEAGKIFSIFFLVFGVFSVFYAVGTIIDFIVEGTILGIRRRKKMDDRINHMKGHYIVCGYGRVGHQIAQELKAHKLPFVVIDQKESTAEELKSNDIPYYIGSLSDDVILEKAGVTRAKVLFAAADSDIENVYVTLAAKVVNPEIVIVARASHKEVENKLRKAGANKVISPYFIAGSRMASMAVSPVSVEFLDIATGSDNVEMWVREFHIGEKSPLAGRTLGEANIRKATGTMILSIKKAAGDFELTPKSSSKMESGDIIVALGTGQQLSCLENIL
ncbi:MAG: TrkA family potassium uptake protein [Candidatus Margulisiibacteriota bacterium]